MKPYVTDNRNILLLRPTCHQGAKEHFLTTLVYALQRSIQFVYQVEEDEVAVELIGEDENQRLLLWESAEGGTGVWERILADPGSIGTIAREALRVCHFDPETGEPDPAWEGRCAIACYDCLLSYRNQGVHRLLDRWLVRDFLLNLSRSKIAPTGGTEGYEERYRRLLALTDPQSSLEREFLTYLYQHELRLPDAPQNRPDPEVYVQPDFYYERDGLRGVCVFVDGPAHDAHHQAEKDRLVREDLKDRGYRVIAVRYGDFAEAVTKNADVFGAA